MEVRREKWIRYGAFSTSWGDVVVIGLRGFGWVYTGVWTGGLGAFFGRFVLVVVIVVWTGTCILHSSLFVVT